MLDDLQRPSLKFMIRAALDDSRPADRKTLVLLSVVGTGSMNEKLPEGDVSTHATGIQCSTKGVKRHLPIMRHSTVSGSDLLMAESGSMAWTLVDASKVKASSRAGE